MVDRKLLVGQPIIFIALLGALCSFGFIWLRSTGRIEHQTATKDPKTTGATLIQGQLSALRGAMPVNGDSVAKTNSLVFNVPKTFQGKTIKQVRLNGPDKVIALTFDDGPWPPTTPKVLSILKQENVKATFFWVGKMVKSYPQLAKLVVADGHAIANHTWDHSYRRMNHFAAAHEIEATATTIYQTTGVRTFLFRPPGGILNNGVAEYAKKNNYAVMMWSADSIDYRPYLASRLVNNVISQAKPGGIVLMHDGGGTRVQTVKALPQIIALLRERGYRFVTVPQLLEMQQQEPATTVAKFNSPHKPHPTNNMAYKAKN